jgi:hypothetical protein
MVTLRWEEPIHYYDYTPDTVQRHHNRDVFTVAEAYIYNADNSASVHLAYIITGLELHKAGMTMAHAIEEARRHLEGLTRRDTVVTTFSRSVRSRAASGGALAAEVGTWRPPDPGPSRHDGSPHRAASGRFSRLPNTGPECRQCSAPRVSLDRLEAEGQDGALTTPARGRSLFQSAGSASQGR